DLAALFRQVPGDHANHGPSHGLGIPRRAAWVRDIASLHRKPARRNEMRNRSEYQANADLKASVRPAKPYMSAPSTGLRVVTILKIVAAVIVLAAALHFGGVL